MTSRRVLSLTTTEWRSFYETQVAALESAGIEVTTLSVPGDHRAVADDVRRRTPVDYLRYLPNVLREAGTGYDLVHANYGLTAPFAAAASALPTTQLPVVCTLWGGEYVGNRYTPVMKPFVSRADRIVVPSNVMVDRIGRPCDVIPFPVDTALFRPIPTEEARRYIGWDPGERIVLFPYAPSRTEKNFPLAKRTVDGLELDATLRAVANQPYEDVPYYLNAADAVLITSRFESGPMTVKEATACNVPVVSRDVGFARDVLEDVSNSYVADDERALRARLADVLATGEPADGRDRISGYTVADMGERLRGVYERCLENEPT
ncbi:glycosyltransferase family 4 protein [Natrinema sp. 1APR25-10V2]|uniref:glycosyltransferase family 4 protein n=1 Tax=Natrinema sp. 1APR25-10V2 TaxID=2951081 RepID=UPI002875E409|nr:glycosyltransferase family 4 protein [Natrinema sp. 1APR25-10V2]MDS0474950.1 glycosyltransferase family 4 protein [Natrinema sp. 1APR25-10V2]